MRESLHPPPGQFSDAPAEAPLSPRRAFVVQFREETETALAQRRRRFTL